LRDRDRRLFSSLPAVPHCAATVHTWRKSSAKTILQAADSVVVIEYYRSAQLTAKEQWLAAFRNQME
jgi:hypothetical protein